MNETEFLESIVSEYTSLLKSTHNKQVDRFDIDQIVRKLSRAHDWSDSGARAIISLANDYGSFMLRDALALAIALGKEDGELGF